MTTIPPHLRGTATLVDRQTGEVLYEPESEKVMEVIVGVLKRRGDKRKQAARQLCPALRAWQGSRLIVTVPVETRSESNLRDWRARSRRSGSAWKAVRSAVDVGDLKVFQDRVRIDHGAVEIVLTRLGGRKLDKGNLPGSMKGVEDAIAYLLDIDDGSLHWSVRFEQEPGNGPMGVRIELE